MENCSRRSFLKGGALVGGVAALSMLAGCAADPKPAGDSIESPSTQADAAAAQGGPWSWSVPPEPIADDSIAEVVDTDVLIIGAGCAGAGAAMYAGLNGIDAVVLQKSDKPRTNGVFLGMWNSPIDAENEITCDIPATMQMFSETYSNGRVNLKLFKRLLERTGEAADYLVKNIGPIGGSDPKVMEVGGHLCYWWDNGQGWDYRYDGWRAVIDREVELAEQNGVKVFYSTPAIMLTQGDDKTVTGAIGQREDGSYVKVNAAKGVLLATGDITDDQEMLRCYAPVMEGVPSMHGTPCNTGDGHKMGLWVGGRMDLAQHAIMMHYDPSSLSPITPPYSAAPWLHVNIYGERFMNENIDYQSSASSVAMQPQHTAFQIIDSNYAVNVNEYKNGFRSGTPEKFEAAVKAGSILKADTIEDLADQMRVDKDTLVATVARYNELVDKGVDEDFGMASEYFVLSPIKQAPFYAIERIPSVLATCGGLRCTDELKVLDNDDNVIPGLWVAGNVQGSMFGYDYPVTGFQGLSLGRALTGGILAVKSMVGTFDEAI